MNYNEAFNHVIDKNSDSILDENFLVRCLLFDLVGTSYKDKELVDAFYIINQINVIKSIASLSLKDAKELIKKRINELIKKYTFVQYVKSIEPILLRKYHDKYQPIRVVGRVSQKVTVSKKNTIPLPVKSNKKEPLKTFNDVDVFAKCGNLTIKTHNKKRVMVIDSNNVDVTNVVKINIQNERCSISIDDNGRTFTILLPNKKYHKMNLSFKGLMITIRGDGFLAIKEFNALIDTTYSHISVASSKVTMKQEKGSVFVSGSITNLTINSDKADVSAMIYGEKINKYWIKTTHGNISFMFMSGRIYPKINHLFRTVRSVNSSYLVSYKEVKLYLDTLFGKVKCF